jgi:hypothetical protein
MTKWEVQIKNQSFRNPLIDKVKEAGPLGMVAEKIRIRLFEAGGAEWLRHPSWGDEDLTLFVNSRVVFEGHQYDLVDRAADLRSSRFRMSEGLRFQTLQEQMEWVRKQRERLAYAELEF